jgi:hypothetical protein
MLRCAVVSRLRDSAAFFAGPEVKSKKRKE